VVELPAGPRNSHWTKSLVASPDGSLLYSGVGSNSNVAEHGMEEETGRAAIWEIDPATRRHRIFASGLRNPVGMDWEPSSGALWTAVNERDELGSDLVPDYMTSVRDGGFYGWPYRYFGAHVDTRVKPPRRSASPSRAARPRCPRTCARAPSSGSTGRGTASRTGFVDAEGHAWGRPVGVAIDGRGGLLVADDVGNAVWRVSAAAGTTASR
jgi:glucose/arabinose dehydrogenase